MDNTAHKGALKAVALAISLDPLAHTSAVLGDVSAGVIGHNVQNRPNL
jgi:hypothetical protein